jgi:hypothetical protein
MFKRRCRNCGQRAVDRKSDICAACGTAHIQRAGSDWVFTALGTIGVPTALFLFVFGWWAAAAGFVGLFIILSLIDFYWPLKIKRDV